MSCARYRSRKRSRSFCSTGACKAYAQWLKMREPTLGPRALQAHRLSGHLVLLGAARAEECAEEPRRGGSEAARDLREARHSAARARAARRGRGGRRVRQRLGGDHLQGQARQGGRHLLLLLGRRARSPGAHRGVSGDGGPRGRQFLRGPEFRRVLRRLLRVRAERRALSDGAVDLFPDQRGQDRSVRAHAHHRRGGRHR